MVDVNHPFVKHKDKFLKKQKKTLSCSGHPRSQTNTDNIPKLSMDINSGLVRNIFLCTVYLNKLLHFFISNAYLLHQDEKYRSL